MLCLAPSVRIYLHAKPIDMRKSFDGLFGIIKNEFSMDVRDGGLFLFINLRRNRVKLIYWDTDGLVIWMACWAHARRKIFEAKDNDRTASALPLALIRQLYEIERLAMDWPNEKRTAIRQSESRLILDRLRTWLDGWVAKSILPASKLGQAVQYIRNHWDALCVYTKDGRLPVDNNWVERLMKRIAIGRKNRLFVGSVRAGMRNANIMTLVASAHRHDLDVHM